ncbi:MAG TPA: hypothetical protein DCO79_12050 [Spirochaeta sp.]|nr:hypothetical protein [Spirochaeta sp.]
METKKITIDDAEIVYSQMGQGPVILYVHGNLGSRIWFERNMDIPGFTTIAPDMPNFGDSDTIEDQSMEEYGRRLALFTTEVAPEGLALLVGHSLGGAVAMEAAFRIPEKIGAMLLVDSCPIDGLKTPETYHPVIAQYKTDRKLLTTALGGVVPALKNEDILGHLVEQAMKMKEEAFIGHAVELGKVNYEVPAAGFTAPVLVIRGELDVLISEVAAEALAAAFPNGNYEEIADAGHSLMVENPTKFNKIISGFLR